MKKIASLFGAALALPLIATPAAAEVKLFKKYAYGAPVSEFNTQPGYYDCSADVGPGAICLDDVEFVGSKFTAALVFSGDKLYMLSLIREFDNDTYTKTMGALAKSWGATGFDFAKAIEAGYGTDSAALAGGAALRKQSLERGLLSYWDFRDDLAARIRSGEVKSFKPAELVKAAQRIYGMSVDIAAASVGRFLGDLQNSTRKDR